MTARDRLAEMGLLDLCLAICAKHHVSLSHLVNETRRHAAWPALIRARVELVAQLLACGFSWAAMSEVIAVERTTLHKMYTTHGPKLAKVVPITQKEKT